MDRTQAMPRLSSRGVTVTSLSSHGIRAFPIPPPSSIIYGVTLKATWYESDWHVDIQKETLLSAVKAWVR